MKKLLLALAAATLCGCATPGERPSAQTERLLAAAGFEKLPADARLPQHAPGSALYAYSVPGCNCRYVGSSEAYAKYREYEASEAVAADMSVGEPNSASAWQPSWAVLDPHWAPTDAWDDPHPALTDF
jgi:hypothetical protein